MKHLLFIVLLCSSSYYYWITRPVTHGPGEVAPNQPVQTELRKGKPLYYDDIKLIPKANLEIEARILSVKKYYLDSFSKLTDTDVVFGWGPMSDEENLDNILIKQSDRSFRFEMTKRPIPQEKMQSFTDNMHLIAPDEEMEEQLQDLREGQIVYIDGILVDADSPSGWMLKTSLTRDDHGSKGSELVWIKSLTIR